MDPVIDSLDYSMVPGQSKRIRECRRCIGTGNSKAVQVTRKEDGFLAYCFRCNKTYFYRDTGASPQQVQEVIKNAGKKKEPSNNRPAVVTLPGDYTSDLPPSGLVQLYNLRLTDEDIKRHDIGWSPSSARIIIPVYKYGRGPGGWSKKLVGHLGRRVDSLCESTPDKPKWATVRQADVKHPRFVALPTTIHKDKEVVIVEDVFSAIRVASCGYMCMSLLTTYLPYELYPMLAGWKVYIWLDSDAYEKAVKYHAALCSNNVNATTIYTDLDPKTYDDHEIKEAITYGRIKSRGSKER
jgi:hypothetical protein